MTLRLFLLTVGLPLAIMFVAVGLARALRPRTPGGPTHAEWMAVLGIGAGVVVGSWQILGSWPEYPPPQSTQWVVYAAIASTVIGLAVTLLPAKAAWATGAVLLLALGALVLKYPLKGAVAGMMGEGWTKWAWCAGAVSIVAVPTVLAWAGASRARHAGTPAAVMIGLLGGVAAMMAAEGAKNAQLASVLSMPMGVMMAAALWWRPWETGRGVLAVLLPVHGLLWLITHFYNDAHWSAMAVGALAPAAAGVGAIGYLSRRPRACAAVQIVLAAGLAALGASLVKVGGPPPSPEEEIPDMYKEFF